MSGNLNLQVILSLVDQLTGPAQKALADLGKGVNTTGPDASIWTGQAKAITATSQQVQAFTASIGQASNAANLLTASPWLQQQQAAQTAKTAVEDYKEGVSGIRGLLGDATTAMLGFVAAHAGLKLAKDEFRAGVDASHSAVSMETSGMSAGEIAEVKKRAAALSGQFPAQSQTDIEKLITETRTSVGSTHEALEVMPEALRLKTIVEAEHGGTSEGFGSIIKGLEIAGVTQDMGKFRAYMDDAAKAMNVFKKTISPEGYYEFFKYTTSPIARELDRNFVKNVAPTLIQELGGSSAGVALRAFETEFVGSRLSKKAAMEIEKLGLIGDESKVARDAKGNIKWMEPGAIKGSDVALHDPRQMAKILSDAMNAKGMNAKEQSEALFGVMENAQARQMMSILMFQQQRLEKEARLMDQAPGLSAADTWLKKDAGSAVTQVKSQLDNTFRDAAEPVMPAVTKGLQGISGALQWWRDFTADSKRINTEASAAVVGGSTWFGAGGTAALASRFGLTGVAGGASKVASYGKGGFIGAAATAEIEGLIAFVKATSAEIKRDNLNWRGDPGSAQLGLDWNNPADRERIFSNADRRRDEFRRDPEAYRGHSMMQRDGAPATGQIDEAVTKAQEAGETIKTALNVTAAPQVDSSSLDALIAKAKQAKGLLDSLNAASGALASSGRAHLSGALHDGPEAR